MLPSERYRIDSCCQTRPPFRNFNSLYQHRGFLPTSLFQPAHSIPETSRVSLDIRLGTSDEFSDACPIDKLSETAFAVRPAKMAVLDLRATGRGMASMRHLAFALHPGSVHWFNLLCNVEYAYRPVVGCPGEVDGRFLGAKIDVWNNLNGTVGVWIRGASSGV